MRHQPARVHHRAEQKHLPGLPHPTPTQPRALPGLPAAPRARVPRPGEQADLRRLRREKPTYSCRQCGREDNCYGRNCGPCTLTERATELLTDPDTGQIHQQLQPIFNALMNVDRPQTTLYWFRRSEGPRILHRMATGELQISHETFEQLPSNKTTNYLRDFLTALGVLPHYEARIERMLPWLEDLLDTIPKSDADIVRRFAQWRVLRHLRQKSAHDQLTKSMVLQGRAQIKGAARFLAWLTRHDTTLAGMGQADLERYLITHPGSETAQHAFIGWVRTSGINTSLRIPKQPRRFSSVTMSEEERWATSRPCSTTKRCATTPESADFSCSCSPNP